MGKEGMFLIIMKIIRSVPVVLERPPAYLAKWRPVPLGLQGVRARMDVPNWVFV